MNIIERFDMADLGAMSRLLRKRGLTVKMTAVDTDTITMRVTVIPEPPPKPAPLLEAANAATDAALDSEPGMEPGGRFEQENPPMTEDADDLRELQS